MAVIPARAFRYDIVLRQGMDEYFPMRIEDPHGTMADLDGWTATLALYRAPATLASLHDEPPVSAPGATVTLGTFDGGDPATGGFGLYNVLPAFPSATTSALSPWGNGIYNIDISDSFGHVQYRIEGTIVLVEGTRHE